MRSKRLTAALARLVRRLRPASKKADDTAVPMTAVGALIAGVLLSVGFLAVTESRAPAVQRDLWEEQDEVRPLALQEEHASTVTPPDREDDVVTAAAPAAHDTEVRWFNNRPIRPARTVSMLITAYSPDERSCGKWADGVTASGYSVWTNGMKLVAADTSILPFGSLVSVPGYDDGAVVPVLDRGGAIRGNRLDVLYPTHERALEWGVQRLEVTIWEYADGEPNGFRQQHRR